LKLDYRVFLKELGTDKVIEVDITFDHEVAIKDGLKSEEVDDTYYWVKYIDSGKLKKISDWLNLGLDSKECATVLYCLAIQYQLRKSYIRRENPEEWNGQIISELERVKNKYLKDEKEWAKDIDYVATRIGVKLALMNRIKVCSRSIAKKIIVYEIVSFRMQRIYKKTPETKLYLSS
jgi:hypothetical protein